MRKAHRQILSRPRVGQAAVTGYPTVISFWYGADYYRESADRLRADCERLGLDHDIVELQDVDGLDWTEICRRKVGFYRERIEDPAGPVMWVDADCRIL